MEVKIDREWSTFLKIFEKFFLHRVTGVLELPQAGSPLTGGSFLCTG